LRYNDEYRRRIEFIQDYEFPVTSNRVQMSKDGKFLIAAGCYPPSVKVFDLSQLCMYFERRFDEEIVDFIMLEDDWKKIVFLRADRTLEFHSQFGLHEKIRVPKFGRSLAYNRWTCELYITCNDTEVFRLNMEQGQFFAPFVTNIPDILCSSMNPIHEILAVGGTNCTIELWDTQSRQRKGIVDVSKVADIDIVDQSPTVTALQFDKDGLTLAAGISTGEIVFFDIRSQQPIKVLDHRYGLPIIRIHFHESSNKIYTCDSKIVKIWDRDNFSLFTSITPEPNISDLAVCPETGVSFLTVEDRRCQAYFIPSLGPAPSWCTLLESLTEELEEKKQTTIYTDYKFVTRDQLKDLGLENLIGSGLLKAYMHGFFMHNRLYANVKKVLGSTDVYEQYIKSKTKKAISSKREQRISVLRKLPSFNRKYAMALAKKTAKKKPEGGLLSDPRFKKVWEDEDFEIDTASSEYNRVTHGGRKKMLDDSNFLQNFNEVEASESEEEEAPKMYTLKEGYIPEQVAI